MSSSTPKVLVVGSGPAGLVLALCLLKNGIAVRIIEKDEKHHNGERGCGIQPRTLELEHFLGNIDKEVTDAGYLVPSIHIYDPKDPTAVIKKMPFREHIPATASMPETRTIILGQWKHQEILRRRVEALGVDVELGTELVGLDQDASHVHATLAKKIDAGRTEEEKSAFDFVIGADGARSFVRHAMGVDFEGETRQDSKVFIVDARLKGMSEEKGFHTWGNQAKQAVMMRSCNEPDLFQMLFMGQEVNFDDFKFEGDIAASVQKQFNLVTGRTDIEVLSVQWQGEWRPNLRIASTFRKGRLFVVGDAAHTHSPTGGQGLNTSVQDSINLAWKMAYVLKGLSADDILDSYCTERLPVISEMLNITTDLYKKVVTGEIARQNMADVNAAPPFEGSAGTPINGMTGPPNETRGPPGVGSSALGSRAWFSGRKLLQLDINYRWSEIVYDERHFSDNAEKKAYGEDVARAVRAGDRAPDAPGLDCLYTREGLKPVTRIFDIFNATHHTALVVADEAHSAKPFLDALAAFPVGTLQTVLVLTSSSPYFPAPGEASTDYVIQDTGRNLSEGYGISQAPAAIVVRPDSWVGAIALSPSGVEQYLSRIFGMR